MKSGKGSDTPKSGSFRSEAGAEREIRKRNPRFFVFDSEHPDVGIRGCHAIGPLIFVDISPIRSEVQQAS